MRAFSLTSMGVALGAFICLCNPTWAQNASTEKPSSPQTLTAPGGKDARDTASTKDAPKHGEAVTKSDPKAHVNALSPEEKRRAERARERAASRGTATKRVEKNTVTKAAEPPSASARSEPAATKPASGSPPRVPAKETAATDKAGSQRASGADEYRRTPPAKNRRASVREPKWRPRVGGLVPRGIPLYPVPPGYRPGGFYDPRPPWRYLPGPGYPPYPRLGRAYPPIPRGDMDDDDIY